MKNMKVTIGKNIRILRKQRGQTLKSLSEQIGITHQQLSRIETGGGTSSTTLERIATILDVDMTVLIDEPEANLHRTIDHTKNYVPETVCQSMYAKLFSDIIKRANDTAIENYLGEVYEKIVRNAELTRNLMVTHAGTKENYHFTSAELFCFCQCMFVEFADYATRLTKVEQDTNDEFYWKDDEDITSEEQDDE